MTVELEDSVSSADSLFESESLSHSITSAVQSIRIKSLKDTLRYISTGDDVICFVLDKLILTTTHHYDGSTRRLVHDILQVLFRRTSSGKANLQECGYVLLFIKTMQKTAMQAQTLPAHMSLLKSVVYMFDWILEFETEKNTINNGFITSIMFSSLLDTLSQHLDAISAFETPFSKSMYSRIEDKLIRRIRRYHVGDALLKKILRADVVEGKEGSRYALLIHICVKSVESFAILEPIKAGIIKFLVKAILLSKTTIPSAHLAALEQVVSSWVTIDVFKAEFLGASEKCFLRSPEVTLNILNKLISFVSFDTTSLLSSTYADLLLNQLKSTNEVVRNNGYELFVSLLKKSSDTQLLVKVTEIIKKGFTTKSPSLEAKALYFALFADFPAHETVSRAILDVLAGFATKETNESCLLACLSSWSTHANHLLSLEKSDMKEISNFLTSGLKQSKSYLKRPYLFALKNMTQLHLIGEHGIEDIASTLLAYYDSLPSQPSQFMDSSKEAPKLVEAYLIVLVVIRLIRNSSLLQSSVNQGFERFFSSSSIIISDKFYSKFLTEEMEQSVFAEAIKEMLSSEKCLSILASDMQTLSKIISWSFLRLGHSSRRVICNAVSSLMHNESSPHIRAFFNASFVGLVPYVDESDSVTKMEALAWEVDPVRSSAESAERVLVALHSLLPESSTTPWVSEALEQLLVFSNFPTLTKIHQNDFWIRLCIRSKCDPAALLQKSAQKLIHQWRSKDYHDSNAIGGFYHPSSVHREATFSALRLMTEVSPDMIYPLIVPWARERLLNDEIRDISTKDVLIWKTPAGVLFEDPLSEKSSDADYRNMNADQRWELELQKEIAAKKGNSGTNRKLTKAEKELQEQQLAAESEIRQHVSIFADDMKASIACLDALLEGVSDKYGPAGFDILSHWYIPILETLISVILREYGYDSTCGVLAGLSAVHLYEKVVKLILSHFSQNQESHLIFSLVLKSLNLRDGLILPIFEKALFEKLVMEFLEKTNETFSASRLLPAHEFTILLTLVESIIFKKGICTNMKEKSHIGLVIAIADLAIMHASLEGPHYLVPRQRILAVLIRLMDRYPNLRASAQGAFLALSIAAADAYEMISDEEDLSEAELAEHATSAVVLDVIHALSHQETSIRTSALDALLHLPIAENVREAFDIQIWMAIFDTDPVISEKARALWNEFRGHDIIISGDMVAKILQHTIHSEQHLRINAGVALGKTLETYTDLIDTTLESLYELYAEKEKEPMPEYDHYGVVIKESLNKEDEWRARAGVANALAACIPVLKNETRVMSLLSFLIEKEALGDRNDYARRQLLDVGLTAIKQYGSIYTESMLSYLQKYLEHPAKATKTHDQIRESVVLLFGTLAQHLKETDPRIKQVVDKLLDTLTTPSEVVQVAVSECLPSLIKLCKNQAVDLLDLLLTRLFHSEKYGDRRGAAYGLAGVVKGYGIGALKEFAIMDSLKEAVEDKKSVQRREGALFAFETLSLSLGRLFEPYVIQILPHLLVCFGDANKQIRNATEDTCRVIMSRLSAHCVKLLLPSLLRGLEEKAWRTQIGSIEVMASMSALAPKQLSQSLPTIVPRLCGALADSHQKVQDAAKQALVQFGNVIKNPEIQALVPVLISALVDPNRKTQVALSQLLETTFVHYIDAPSLALLMPIVHRGLKERSAEIKRKGAQIMGNMASLTDKNDLLPYLPTFMPSLKEVLVDPVPEARATAAHAFGTMVKTLGEDNFPELVAELIKTLKSDTSGVDRSGAAQGLSEVLAGLGLERLRGLMPEILANTSSPKSYVREGFMTLLVYLPATFGDDFTNHLDSVIEPILLGLADDSESVRDAAFRAGQVIIRKYASTSVTIFLPSLEKGLFDDNWRIRQSSVQLLGDLLFRIAGVSSKVDTDEIADDEGVGTEQGRQNLKSVLGLERYESILAALYIVRADSHAVVRQASLHVWKAIITNTPKTLKEIMSIVMKMVIESLASSSLEKQGVAARTLGELVRKMGDVILHEVMPIFEKGLDSEDAAIREGVCLGMSEIMNAGGKTHILDYISQYTALIRKALVNSESTVREAAAQAFDILHQHIGSRAVDEIVPALLRGLLSSGDEGYELEGLRELMAVRNHVIFPVLIPSLITVPITVSNAQALSSLIPVAGPALVKKISSILPALMDSMDASNESFTEIEKCSVVLLSSVNSSEGVHQVLTFLGEMIQEGSTLRKQRACAMLATFFSNTTENFDMYVSDWLRTLVGMLSGVDGQDVMKSAWYALDALVKRIRKEDMDKYVADVRKGIKEAEFGLMPSEDVPGYNMLPKSIEPMLSIFLQGLMFGSSDIREQSALGIGELISRTSTTYLKPFVTQITGSLIRVVGDRLSVPTRTAILHTIAILLVRVPALVKPFLPQMQRIFVKALSDSSGSSSLRDRSAQCLALLIPLQPRLDPLVVELTNGLKSAEETKVRAGIWDALYGLLKGLSEDKTGKSINDANRTNIENLIMDLVSRGGESDVEERISAAKCFGELVKFMNVEHAQKLIETKFISSQKTDWGHLQGTLLCLVGSVKSSPFVYENSTLLESVIEFAITSLKDEKAFVVEASVDLLAALLSIPSASYEKIVQALTDASKPGLGSSDARRDAITALKTMAKTNHTILEPYLPQIIPVLMTCVRDRTIPVKLAAERALMYALEMKNGAEALEKNLSKLDASIAKTIGDYARRVLAKTSAKDSDDEDEMVFS